MRSDGFNLSSLWIPVRFVLLIGVACTLSSPVRSQQNLYVAQADANLIQKFDSNGVGTRFDVSGTLNAPQFPAFDRAGNLYISNAASTTIEKFNRNGVGTVFASGGLLTSGTTGMAIDPLNNLYVVNNNSIIKITSGGVASTFSSGGSLNNPPETFWSQISATARLRSSTAAALAPRSMSAAQPSPIPEV